MTRRPSSSIAASPLLVGATSVLVALVAVVLAYRANQGLPFVPTVDAKVRIANAELLGKGSEVKEGGFRIGFVETVRPVKLPNGEIGAEADVKLANDVRLPVDSTFVIRPRSPLGLKYLEVTRGEARRSALDGHTFAATQASATLGIDRVNEQFDARTRPAVQRVSVGAGTALAGRGEDLNRTIAELPRLFRRLEPVARNLSSRETNIGRFLRETGDAARVVAPLARTQVELFADGARTFEAISRDTEALKATIERTHPTLNTSTRSFRVQQPFLAESVALAREMRPAVAELRAGLPSIDRGLEAGVEVLPRTPPLYRDTGRVLRAIEEFAEDPQAVGGVEGARRNVEVLNPLLRYLGPYQTVCNYWTYWWTYLGEHISQETPYGFAQRVLLKQMPRQRNSPGSMGATEPANGEGHEVATSRSGPPMHFQGQTYGAAVDDQGRADCESGQRGHPRKLNTIGNPKHNIGIDPHTPGNQGTTYSGAERVPPGQTFTREPEIGEPHP